MNLHFFTKLYSMFNQIHINISLFNSFESFHTSVSFITGFWVTESLQVSRTLLSILDDINNAEVWMVSIRPVISKSSSPFGDCTESTNYNWYNRHFSVFFNFLERSRYLFFFSQSFNFTLLSSRTAMFSNLQDLFYFLIIIKGLIIWPRLGDPLVS